MMIPIGFRFNPTDEELIEILEKKVSGKEMPLHDHFIVETDVYAHKPEDLEWDPTMSAHNEERYYFCIREKASREVSSYGWWKATGHVKKIYADSGDVVGYKRPLTFYKFMDDEKKRNKAIKSNWIMHEYNVESYATEWRICKIKYNAKKYIHEDAENRREDYRLISNDSGGSSSRIIDIQPVLVGEEQQQPQCLEQIEKIYEAEVANEQQQTLYASYDPILMHITSTSEYMGDQLAIEQPYSPDDEQFPNLWSW